MLRPLPAMQDENAGSFRMLVPGAKRAPAAGQGTDMDPLPKGLALRPPGLSAGPRKALGNITNVHSSANATAAALSKPAPVKLGRRALGDITNAQSKPPAPFLKARPSNAQQPAAITQHKPAIMQPESMNSLADTFSKDGVEKLAGKSWQELEADRQLEEEVAWAAVRAKLLVRQLPAWQPALGSAFFSTASSCASSDAENEGHSVHGHIKHASAAAGMLWRSRPPAPHIDPPLASKESLDDLLLPES
mmetsp:Transcript_16430/g.28155  ORF Transcript_16430/g.28155 Transcript_16430/m.28155 type:complete len:248 (-) Transcript_16430:1044-1787(-)